MKRLIIIPIVLLTSVLFLNFVKDLNFNTSNYETESRNLPHFTEIQLSIHAQVFLKQGNEQEVRIEADPSEINIIETEVSNGYLNIKCTERKNKIEGNPRIYITIPEIEGVTISGSGKIIGSKTISSDHIYVKISGSGSILFEDLKANSIDSNISGSGDINLYGDHSINSIDAKISGSGNISAENLSAENANIHISGSGTCKVNVTKKLSAKISGSGDVYYSGTPLIDASVSGSGKVKPL